MSNHPDRLTGRPRAVGYVRVSTASQVADGYGMDVQMAEIKAAARRHRLRLTQVCEDPAISGTLAPEDRPGLTCALEAIADGEADVVLIARLDRLARELTVQEAALATIWRMGGRVVCADGGEVLADDPDDPMRTAMRQMAGVFAQLERSMIAKRLRAGRRHKREAGGYAGGAPRFGTRAESGDLVVDEAEVALAERIRAMHDRGQTIRAIVDALNADRVPTKRGGRWHIATVARIINPERRDGDTTRQSIYRERNARLGIGSQRRPRTSRPG